MFVIVIGFPGRGKDKPKSVYVGGSMEEATDMMRQASKAGKLTRFEVHKNPLPSYRKNAEHFLVSEPANKAPATKAPAEKAAAEKTSDEKASDDGSTEDLQPAADEAAPGMTLPGAQSG